MLHKEKQTNHGRTKEAQWRDMVCIWRNGRGFASTAADLRMPPPFLRYGALLLSKSHQIYLEEV